MERCIAQMMMVRMSQPPSHSLRVRELLQLIHFSSSLRVHNGGCTISLYVLYFLSSYEQHIVPRRIISPCILYDNVLEAIFRIEIGYLIGGLWGEPHDFWCSPLIPLCTFMFTSCRMIVAAKKWLGEHLFLFDLM